MTLDIKASKAFLERRRSAQPKYLFRVFGPGSGGGLAGLNTVDGIIPHAFFNGAKPTTIFDLEDVKAHFDNHLWYASHTEDGEPFLTTLSSWTPHINVALSFLADFETSRIAIVDTALLGEGNEEVYHAYDLGQAGLTDHRYHDEWLIYGPVVRPAFHSVSVREIYDRGFAELDCPPGPLRFAADREPDQDVTDYEIGIARNIARLFESPGLARPDTVIAVTAELVAMRLWYANLCPPDGSFLNDYILRTFRTCLWDELCSVLWQCGTAEDVRGTLVNRHMSTVSGCEITDMIDLLSSMEDDLQASAQWDPTKTIDSVHWALTELDLQHDRHTGLGKGLIPFSNFDNASV